MDRPRWPRPKGSQFSWISWCISVQVKTRRYSQGNYWYQTEETLDTAQHCWCGSTNVGRFLFTRASCWLMVTRRLVWIWAPFIVSIYVIPSSFSSSLEIPTHPYSSWNFPFISQHITKYFVHEYLNFIHHVMSRACENYWKFCYCHINCFHYAWSQ